MRTVQVTHRRKPIRRGKLFAVICSVGLVATFVMHSVAALAMDTGQTKTEHGLTAYLGVIPAEIVKAHPKEHPEAIAHGGPPSGAHEYHLIVAIFDAASGERIADAKVFARVSSLGLAGPQKTLEPMTIANTVTYGNYFALPDKGSYTIDLDIEQPAGAVKMKFVYEH